MKPKSYVFFILLFFGILYFSGVSKYELPNVSGNDHDVGMQANLSFSNRCMNYCEWQGNDYLRTVNDTCFCVFLTEEIALRWHDKLGFYRVKYVYFMED